MSTVLTAICVTCVRFLPICCPRLVVHVVSCCNGSGVRVLRVFSQDMTLHAQGRKEDGGAVPHLALPVAWCPKGSLIAMAQVVRTELQIVFFETNGLRHR